MIFLNLDGQKYSIMENRFTLPLEMLDEALHCSLDIDQDIHLRISSIHFLNYYEPNYKSKVFKYFSESLGKQITVLISYSMFKCLFLLRTMHSPLTLAKEFHKLLDGRLPVNICVEISYIEDFWPEINLDAFNKDLQE